MNSMHTLDETVGLSNSCKLFLLRKILFNEGIFHKKLFRFKALGQRLPTQIQSRVQWQHDIDIHESFAKQATEPEQFLIEARKIECHGLLFLSLAGTGIKPDH